METGLMKTIFETFSLLIKIKILRFYFAVEIEKLQFIG